MEHIVGLGLAAYGSDSNSDSNSDEETFTAEGILTNTAVVTNSVKETKPLAPIPVVDKPSIATDPLVIDLYKNKKNKIDQDVIDRINVYIDKAEFEGFDLINNMNSMKEFSNPYILSNAVEYFNIDQYGSNINTDMGKRESAFIFDPHDPINKEDFISNINKDSKVMRHPIDSNMGTVSSVVPKLVSQQNVNTNPMYDSNTTVSNININNTSINISQPIQHLSGSIHSLNTGANTGGTGANATGVKRKSRFN